MAPPAATLRFGGSTGRLGRAVAGPAGVVRELWRAFGTPTTALGAAVALSVIVCEGFHDVLTPAVFTQTLGWSGEQYSRVQGGWGLLGRIVGAVAGGYLCDRVGRRLMIGVGGSVSAAAFAVFGLSAAWWSTPGYPLALFVVVIQGSIAMTAVATFSLFMKISWTAAAATQFTVYMALSNLGYALGPHLTRLDLGDAGSYLAAAVVALAPVPLLFVLRPDAVERRKLAEGVASPVLG
jgi:hypothetical protein